MTGSAGWLGRLALELDKTPHGTQLSRSSHEGPLRIQRVLTPEGLDCPHLYMLHPPGGVVGGDRLETRVTLGTGARALLTTPAAQKLYRSQGARAEIQNHLELGGAAALEWLPSETLAFSAAQAQISTRVSLAPGASFLGWDIACYGMPARGEAFTAGHVRSRFEIYRGETPLLVEAFDLGDAPQLLSDAYALRGEPVVANLYAVPAQGHVDEALVTQLREAFADSARGLVSVTSLGELLVVRALGPQVESVRARLIQAWQLLRPALLGRRPVPPRIWAT
ncbi:MAG TPA: urease accessory protein UreD [Polyangiaceae bacterium]|nr:urease accessory protein UreD [Polyangiaceae bacterium]